MVISISGRCFRWEQAVRTNRATPEVYVSTKTDQQDHLQFAPSMPHRFYLQVPARVARVSSSAALTGVNAVMPQPVRRASSSTTFAAVPSTSGVLADVNGNAGGAVRGLAKPKPAAQGAALAPLRPWDAATTVAVASVGGASGALATQLAAQQQRQGPLIVASAAVVEEPLTEGVGSLAPLPLERLPSPVRRSVQKLRRASSAAAGEPSVATASSPLARIKQQQCGDISSPVSSLKVRVSLIFAGF